MDFAPVADVKTSELNEEIGDRSFVSLPRYSSASSNASSQSSLTTFSSFLETSEDVSYSFIAVDEEGGRVARIGSNKKMKTTAFPTAEKIGKSKDDKYLNPCSFCRKKQGTSCKADSHSKNCQQGSYLF